VFVLPSIEEGLAMVIGEAMACGCPVIASTNTGASEMISEGVEGFIVPIRSPGLIADRLQQLADQPELREHMGKAALMRVQQLGGWDAYGDAWTSLLQQVA
jgi:glycosyltransferase involved in cell wall biosynthesis